MDTLHLVLAIALISAMWFVPIAAVRVLAWRSGTDATPGMRNVALVAVVGAVGSVLVLLAAAALLLA
jgi:hypothetical protein